MELKEKNVTVQQDPAEIPRSPFNDEDEMIAKAAEGYFVRDPEKNIVYCPMGEIMPAGIVPAEINAMEAERGTGKLISARTNL